MDGKEMNECERIKYLGKVQRTLREILQGNSNSTFSTVKKAVEKEKCQINISVSSVKIKKNHASLVGYYSYRKLMIISNFDTGKEIFRSKFLREIKSFILGMLENEQMREEPKEK